MAPKRRSKTVVTAKKVVEETVQVVVSPPQTVKLISSTKENEKLKISTVPIKSKSNKPKAATHHESQPASDPETAPTPPRKEAAAKKRRKKGGAEGYKRYVFMVMKQVQPGMGISSKAMTIVNNLVTDMFEKLAEEAARLKTYTGRQTLSAREVQGAVKLVLPGELGKHAIAEGTKAVTNYYSYGITN